VHPTFKESKCTNKHDDHLHYTKQSHRRHRRKHDQYSASFNNNNNNNNRDNNDNVVSTKSTQHYQENERSSNECVVITPINQSIKSKKFLHYYTDSDGESERLPVKPWSPTPNNFNGSSSLQFSNNNNNNNDNQDTLTTATSPQSTLALRAIFEMITEDLDKFVYTPAPNGLGDIQCRITRDKHGMEKGLFPTYYMHVERPGDGKKVKKKLN
jgi:hypothetical protein